VETLNFMHEADWGGEGVPCEGHPWTLADRMICEENFDFHTGDWRRHPYWAGNTYLDSFALIAPKIDELIARHGYRHDGGRYLCGTDRQETFAVFSHGGSGACALAHLLNVPLPWVVTVLPYDFTSIIILEFPVRKGAWVHPRVELFNDIAHIRGTASGPVFQAAPDPR
jgi:probable phosphoglycerate mutase